jgi:hypothetical protein
LSKIEGATGDVVENARSGSQDTGIRDTGRACACDGISWEHAENKDTPEPNRKSPFGNALVPGSSLLTPALQKMKVQPEMLLKTKEG